MRVRVRGCVFFSTQAPTAQLHVSRGGAADSAATLGPLLSELAARLECKARSERRADIR